MDDLAAIRARREGPTIMTMHQARMDIRDLLTLLDQQRETTQKWYDEAHSQRLRANRATALLDETRTERDTLLRNIKDEAVQAQLAKDRESKAWALLDVAQKALKTIRRKPQDEAWMHADEALAKLPRASRAFPTAPLPADYDG